MMIKTLYTRVALTFSVVVLISVSLAFPLAMLMYSSQVNTGIQTELMKKADELAKVIPYMKEQDLVPFLEWEEKLNDNITITLVDTTGSIKYFADKTINEVRKPEADRVLRGERYIRPGSSKFVWEPSNQMVGIPFAVNSKTYALFVAPKRNDTAMVETRKALLKVLTMILIIGSTLILLASRYIVNPIKKLTYATDQLAKGNFDIQIKSKSRRQDEIGILTDSFNRMAGELKQIEEMRQDFVSNVSHEIQSPLTSIRGFSKLLKDTGLPEEERIRYLGIIEKESERLSRLSDNLLKLASLESEHHPFQASAFSLDEQLRRAVLALEPLWTEKEMHVQLTLPKVKIWADADQLNQVWMNLIGNAIKFTPPGGRIHIQITVNISHVVVNISDSGIGIRPEEKERIFERFYKSDVSRQSKTGGSGLGLAIVRKIIDLHKGEIKVESTPGKGTTFSVFLPAGL